jgi:poly-gamma-glutamate capsule biosynthesis protein CapA/YwtB (metallophosphatase superfamily)
MTKPPRCEIDWKAGEVIYHTDNAGVGKEWTVVITGDWAPMYLPEKEMIEHPSEIYGDLLPILNDADLGIVNLEGVFLQDMGKGIIKDGIQISFPDDYVKSLTSASLNLACLANNHAMDFGIEGLKRTVSVLSRNNIYSIGSSFTQEEMFAPFCFEREGYRLGIINISEGEEGKANAKGMGVAPINLLALKERLESLKQEVDFIVLIIHAGREYLRTPPPYIQEIYHQLVDFGANLIVGHHPHVYQGIEIYKNSPIFYSLGNFLFYYETVSQYQQAGFFLKCSFRDSQINRIQMIPYSISNTGMKLITNKNNFSFMEDLKKLSDFIGDSQKIKILWDAFADDYFDRYGLTDLIENSIILENNRLWLKSVLRGYLERDKEPSLRTKITHKCIGFLMSLLYFDKNREQKRNNVYSKGAAGVEIKNHSAAVLKNRFDTLAHRELFLTMLGRLMDGEIGNSPDWAKELIKQWELP